MNPLSCSTRTILILAVVSSLVGCKSISFDLPTSLPWSQKEKLVESEYQDPIRMATVWTPDAVAGPGQNPSRGFGGRFFFYNNRSQAVPVEGQLVVYAYDDSQQTGTQRKPNRRFVFTPDQFNSHFAESDLGASYSVWLPWDEVGGEQRSISLVPVFTSTNGKIVMGQQAMNVLPGPVGDSLSNGRAGEESLSQLGESNQPTDRPAALAQDTITQDKLSQTDSKQRIKTTTITVPNSLRQRMIAAGDSPAPTTRPPVVSPEGEAQSQLSATPSTVASHPPTASQPTGRPDHFVRPRFPAPRAPTWQQGRGRDPLAPNLRAQLSDPAYSP
jgi:hypothetical protein